MIKAWSDAAWEDFEYWMKQGVVLIIEINKSGNILATENQQAIINDVIEKYWLDSNIHLFAKAYFNE